METSSPLPTYRSKGTNCGATWIGNFLASAREMFHPVDRRSSRTVYRHPASADVRCASLSSGVRRQLGENSSQMIALILEIGDGAFGIQGDVSNLALGGHRSPGVIPSRRGFSAWPRARERQPATSDRRHSLIDDHCGDVPKASPKSPNFWRQAAWVGSSFSVRPRILRSSSALWQVLRSPMDLVLGSPQRAAPRRMVEEQVGEDHQTASTPGATRSGQASPWGD
jgi:hypothetical protein